MEVDWTAFAVGFTGGLILSVGAAYLVYQTTKPAIARRASEGLGDALRNDARVTMLAHAANVDWIIPVIQEAARLALERALP